MKYSKTTLRELTAKYRSVLKKCALFNATVLMAMAVSLPTMADIPFTGELTGDVTGMTDTGGTVGSPNTIYFVTKGTTGIIGDDFTISGNKAASGVFQTSGSRSKLIVGKSTFTDNEAIYDGGAIASFGDLEIKGTTFTENVAQTENASDTMPMGGGAIALGAVSVTSIEDATFTENESKYHGGAIATRVGADYNNSSAKLDIIGDTTFTGNEALTSGGAIYNGAYNDANGNGSVNVTDATFTGNKAVTGGAVYNSGEKDNNGSYGKMTITNGTFTGNTAINGAAIYNQGELTLVGGTVQNNTASEEGAIVVKGITDGAEGDARAKLTIDGVTFKDNVSEGGNAGEGGALTILRGADVEITGATVFEGNTAAVAGGAIATYGTKTSGYNTLTVTGTEDTRILFKENEGFSYGAVGLFSQADFTNVDFEGNASIATEAEQADGGGAVIVGSASKTTFNKVSFDGNTSAAHGGAFATRVSLNASGSRNSQVDATLDIENAEFENNVAVTKGGAIFNTFYNDKAGSGSVRVATVTFTGNEANEGGAIYNDGNADAKGNYASMTVTDGTFTGNKATTLGGAVYNAENATMTLAGTSTFTGNTAGGIANDIHNLGTLVIPGATTIDGGITGTGDLTVSGTGSLDIGTTSVTQGTVTFESGSALVANLLNTTSYGSLTADTITATGADLKLTVGASGEYVVITGAGADTFNEATVEESSLFDLTTVYDETAKTLTLTATAKSGEDMATATGANQQSGSIMSGLASGTNDVGSQILINVQNEGLTGKALDGALETLAPTSAPVTTSVTSDVAGRISSIVGSQMSRMASGRSGGDTEVDVDVWVKGMFSKAKQDASHSSAGFRGYTQGVAMGMDAVIDKTYTIGAGYAFSQTDVKSAGRKTDVEGHNFFVYGEYQPSEWFVRGMATYGMSDYEEKKDVTGVRVDADYDVDVYGGEVMTGYDFASGITPSVGMRYLHIKQDSYEDTAGQRVKTDDADLLTAVAGVKYAYDMTVENTVFTPEVHVAATYDVISDNTEATVTLGGATYTADGKRLPRFGVEAGVGMGMRIDDCVDLTVGYDISVRRDYTVHTGTAKLEFAF